jgi:hypothetical protein
MFGMSKPPAPPKGAARKSKQPAHPGELAEAEAEALVDMTIQLLPAQREKLLGLGGAEWIRHQIDIAKSPRG